MNDGMNTQDFHKVAWQKNRSSSVYFCWPKHKLLEKTHMDYINLTPNKDVDENGLIFELGSLYHDLHQVSDTHKPKGKLYSLPLLWVLMILVKLGGEDKPSGIADWVAHRTDLLYEMKILSKKRAPSHMTYRRVLQDTVQPAELEALICEFYQNRLETSQEVVFSMDGKTLRGTIPSAEMRGTH